MQVGIDTAAAAFDNASLSVSPSERLLRLVEQIERADQVVGIHSLGYVAETTQEAADDFFPGYAHTLTEVGKERGWPEVTREGFDAQRGPKGALLIGDPDEVVEKIVRHSKALGGISRITFTMEPTSLPQVKLMRAIELIGTRVAPALREELGGNDGKDG
jgi:alkanesulfonate monooxygenase SsuD/methylene tetrahydromethanopterin reductase-like flavin-dependent oxidoreductase (luciferase family)